MCWAHFEITTFGMRVQIYKRLEGDWEEPHGFIQDNIPDQPSVKSLLLCVQNEQLMLSTLTLQILS